MASKKVEFIINIGGNAMKGVSALTEKVRGLERSAHGAGNAFKALGAWALGLSGVINIAEKAVSMMGSFTDASTAQAEAEAKLAQVMRNTMGATEDQIAGIKELASAQQRLGVIGDEVQLAGAQELGTYLSKAESLKKLMPVMNDMLAQQYGLNASQEQATQIASMMGKVMDGQVGALSRYGYKFSEAQEKLLKYGTEEQRVATLAEVIEQSVGGMNDALAATPEGRLKQAVNRLGDMKERVGFIIQRLKIALLPVMEAAMRLSEKMLAKVEQFADRMASNSVVPKLIDGIKRLCDYATGVMEQLRSAVAPVFNSIRGNLSRFGEMFSGTFRSIKEHVIPSFLSIAGHISMIVGRLVDWVANSTLVRDLFRAVLSVCGFIYDVIGKIAGAVQWIFSNVVIPLLNILDGIWVGLKKKWGWLSGTVKSFIGWVKGVFSRAGAWFGNVMRPVLEWFDNLKAFVNGRIESIRGGLKAVRDWLAGTVMNFIGWISGIFGRVDAWFDRVMHPVVEWFGNLKAFVKGILDKIVEWMGRVVNPIVKLWNRLTGSSVDLVSVGGKDTGGTTPASLVNEKKSSTPLPASAQSAAAKGATAAVTGGKRDTTVNINLGKMIENVIFNGTYGDNAQNLERQVTEIMYRVLAIAATV